MNITCINLRERFGEKYRIAHAKGPLKDSNLEPSD